MQNFGDASNFEVKAMERRIGRAQTDRLASAKQSVEIQQTDLDEQTAKINEEEIGIQNGSTSRPTGYWTKGDPNYMKGVETRNLADMKFLGPERTAYYKAKNWAWDKTTTTDESLWKN